MRGLGLGKKGLGKLALGMIASATLLAGWTGSVAAHEAVDPRNRASFQVAVTREVENDWATARLSAMAEGQDPARVASDVNERIERALATARKEKGVEVESGGYVTQPVYDENRIVRWQAWQEIRLESSDVDRLSKLIGQLQVAGLTLSGIEFSVKRQTREALQNDLTLEALRAFRARADLITKGMGSAAWSMVAMSVGEGGSGPRFHVMRAEADMASMKAAAPAFEAGRSELQITVDGTIEFD